MTEYKEYNSNSSQAVTSRVTKHTSRPYLHDHASSFDEAEESDSYASRRSRRLSESSNRRSIGSVYSLSYVPNRKIEVKEDENNGLVPRRRYTRKWETDDELFKPNHRNSISTISSISTTTSQSQNSPINNYPDEAATTRNLLYLLNKERTNRREIQKSYETTTQELKELQKNHQDDLNALESDIQTLQEALVKENKVNSQLNKLLRESTAKFTEELQMWSNKVALVEEQGKELQKTFQDTMEQLEKEEEEIIRLRKENQSLRDQLAGRSIEPTNLCRNLENVRKVGSMEDRDDLSVSAESKQEYISDNESVATYSKLTELNDRIVELENELITSKENTQKVESSFQELETEKTSAIKQLEEKHKKSVSLLRATISQKQRRIDELEQELRKAKFNEKEKHSHVKTLPHKPSQQFPSPPSPKLQQHQPLQQEEEELEPSTKDDRRPHHRPGPTKRRSIISENFTVKRKNSITSTNSGSVEGTSVTGGSLEDIQINVVEYREGEGEVEGEQSENFSEEEEEEDQSSSVFTGSRNGSEETASVQDPNTETFVRLELPPGRQQHHQLRKGDDDAGVEDYMLDVILSDRETSVLPLMGHYSAAEYTEDEDFDLDYRLSRRQSLVGRNGERFGWEK